MKIGRFLDRGGCERLGVVIEDATGTKVLNLSEAASAHGVDAIEPSMDAFIDGGAAVLEHAYKVADWAVGHADPAFFQAERSVTWLPPVQVRTCFAAGRNFGKHKAETAGYWQNQAVHFHNEIPMGFIKLARNIVATRSTVHCPPESTWFDYEVEPAAVIARPGLRIKEQDALAHVFGYTVFNDLSARDIQRKEMANQTILVGKNLPGFGPLGPWILTADEVSDPSSLELILRVNGQQRQRSMCSDMINTFSQLIASWSAMGMERGDVIAGGTPEGVAIGQKEPANYFLRSGDLVEAEIKQIGVLETLIA